MIFSTLMMKEVCGGAATLSDTSYGHPLEGSQPSSAQLVAGCLFPL